MITSFEADFVAILAEFLIRHITASLLELFPARKVVVRAFSLRPAARLGNTIADEAHGFLPVVRGQRGTFCGQNLMVEALS